MSHELEKRALANARLPTLHSYEGDCVYVMLCYVMLCYVKFPYVKFPEGKPRSIALVVAGMDSGKNDFRRILPPLHLNYPSTIN